MNPAPDSSASQLGCSPERLEILRLIRRIGTHSDDKVRRYLFNQLPAEKFAAAKEATGRRTVADLARFSRRLWENTSFNFGA